MNSINDVGILGETYPRTMPKENLIRKDIRTTLLATQLFINKDIWRSIPEESLRTILH